MSLVVNTNIGSLNAQRSLASSSDELQTAMARLSSGKAINSAADDAAGFAIAERMTAQIRGLNMATKNTNDALSLLAVAESAQSDVVDMMQRIRELAVQAANDTNSATDRGYLQQEVDEIISEIDRIGTQTRFNGENIVDGTFFNKTVQVGSEAGQSINLGIYSLQSADLGFIATSTGSATDGSNVYDSSNNTTVVGSTTFDPGVRAGDFAFLGAPAAETLFYVITSLDDGMMVYQDASQVPAGETIYKAEFGMDQVDLVNDAATSLEVIDNALSQLYFQQASVGAAQNRLEYTVSNLMNVSEYTTAARSRIEDADFAVESARLAKAQVLQQTGTAMLAQANSSSQLVLSLIR